MPKASTIAAYWYDRADRPGGLDLYHGFWLVDFGEPQCFACGREVVSWDMSGLERAHLIDRARGGLDIEANLVLLCRRPCHKEMPSFGPGEESLAIRWVFEHESFEHRALRCLATDPKLFQDAWERVGLADLDSESVREEIRTRVLTIS